jgi:hypothetical protein
MLPIYTDTKKALMRLSGLIPHGGLKSIYLHFPVNIAYPSVLFKAIPGR